MLLGGDWLRPYRKGREGVWVSLIGRDWGRALHPAEVFLPEARACYMRAADRVLCASVWM